MSLGLDELDDAESAILLLVAGNRDGVEPTHVIDTLVSEGYKENVVRAAIWYLLDPEYHAALDLTWDRKLKRKRGAG